MPSKKEKINFLESNDLEISYVDSAHDDRRLKRIAEILSEGIFGLLKKEGRLRENPKLKPTIEKVSKITKKELVSIEN